MSNEHASGGADEAAISLEDRPTGDFIDGYLAGLATVNSALAGARPGTFFYSFDWIGDGAESREASLHSAFQSAPEGMRFEVEAEPDWRGALDRIGRLWLGRDLAPAAAQALADEFVELITAFLAGAPAEVFRVKPLAPEGGGAMQPPIGAMHDHLLFETVEGRMLLEFAIED